MCSLPAQINRIPYGYGDRQNKSKKLAGNIDKTTVGLLFKTAKRERFSGKVLRRVWMDSLHAVKSLHPTGRLWFIFPFPVAAQYAIIGDLIIPGLISAES